MASVDEMRRAFNALFERALESLPELRSWDKVYQFSVTGLGDFYIEIKNGQMSVVEGRHPNPIATLTTTPEVLDKIVKGQLDAMRAFLAGQLKITGNVLDTLNLKKLIDAGLGKASE